MEPSLLAVFLLFKTLLVYMGPFRLSRYFQGRCGRFESFRATTMADSARVQGALDVVGAARLGSTCNLADISTCCSDISVPKDALFDRLSR